VYGEPCEQLGTQSQVVRVHVSSLPGAAQSRAVIRMQLPLYDQHTTQCDQATTWCDQASMTSLTKLSRALGTS
jgi:hypothetical protein